MEITLTRLTQVLIASVATTVLPLGVLESQAGDLAASASVDVVSRYVWRGQVLTEDPVLQPAVTVSFLGLSLNVWGSLDLEDTHDSGSDLRLQEVDYTLSYGFSPTGWLDLEGGVIWYAFPGADTTEEVYGSATLTSCPLSRTRMASLFPSGNI